MVRGMPVVEERRAAQLGEPLHGQARLERQLGDVRAGRARAERCAHLRSIAPLLKPSLNSKLTGKAMAGLHGISCVSFKMCPAVAPQPCMHAYGSCMAPKTPYPSFRLIRHPMHAHHAVQRARGVEERVERGGAAWRGEQALREAAPVLRAQLQHGRCARQQRERQRAQRHGHQRRALQRLLFSQAQKGLGDCFDTWAHMVQQGITLVMDALLTPLLWQPPPCCRLQSTCKREASDRQSPCACAVRKVQQGERHLCSVLYSQMPLSVAGTCMRRPSLAAARQSAASGPAVLRSTSVTTSTMFC